MWLRSPHELSITILQFPSYRQKYRQGSVTTSKPRFEPDQCPDWEPATLRINDYPRDVILRPDRGTAAAHGLLYRQTVVTLSTNGTAPVCTCQHRVLNAIGWRQCHMIIWFRSDHVQTLPYHVRKIGLIFKSPRSHATCSKPLYLLTAREFLRSILELLGITAKSRLKNSANEPPSRSSAVPVVSAGHHDTACTPSSRGHLLDKVLAHAGVKTARISSLQQQQQHSHQVRRSPAARGPYCCLWQLWLLQLPASKLAVSSVVRYVAFGTGGLILCANSVSCVMNLH